MGYLTQSQLRDETLEFHPRVRSAMQNYALTQQGQQGVSTFGAKPPPATDTAESALARIVIQGGIGLGQELAFFAVVAATPGFDDQVDAGDGTINVAKLTDAQLLAQVTANWSYVASLYFNPDGTPIPLPG